MGIVLDEESVPFPGPVAAACEMLGLDPLYVANEGILVAIVAPEVAEWALESLRGHDLGRDAAGIGIVTAEHPGMEVMKTALGSTRIVDTLPGDQLPRICLGTEKRNNDEASITKSRIDDLSNGIADCTCVGPSVSRIRDQRPTALVPARVGFRRVCGRGDHPPRHYRIGDQKVSPSSRRRGSLASTQQIR